MIAGPVRVGSGQPLLLIHGFGASPEDLRPTADALADDHRVVVPDWSATGRVWTRRRAIELLHRTLVGSGANGDVVVVGHSFGGALAVEFAAAYADRLGHLVLVDSLAQSERTVYLRGIVRREEDTSEGSDAQRDEGGNDGASVASAWRSAASFLGTWVRAPGNLTTAALWGFFTDRGEAIEQVRRSSLPRSVLWGHGDTILSANDGRRFASTIGADFRVVAVPTGQVRHQWLVRHPDRFAAVLRDVVDRTG